MTRLIGWTEIMMVVFASWWQQVTDEPTPFGAHDVGGQLGLDLGTAEESNQ